MNKLILILFLIFSILFSSWSTLVGKAEESKLKDQMLQHNLFQYNGQINKIYNVSKSTFKDNNKPFKFFSFINKKVINFSQGQENVAAGGGFNLKRIIRKIIRKHFLKIIDRKRDRQHRKKNILTQSWFSK
ncbi:hypothetical protein [Clostridium sp. ZS2-4]|uniref:hypothetical protein n=1 Tax=Clostridium sp. ZS2-4 TaxID=2987703 RepID=UPI00227BCB18|nr:hypothetical protein [Clostridium sp. ZS2-4]MCY6356791.1 hypothetical protein [Clostridium sp. ZS2-4]